MALSPEEIQIAEYGKAQGKSADEISSAISKYRMTKQSTPAPVQQAQKAPGIVTQAADMAVKSQFGLGLGSLLKPSGLVEKFNDLKQTGKSLMDTFLGGADKVQEINKAQEQGNQGKVRSLLQTFGAGAGTASKAIGDLTTGGIKIALDPAQEQLAKNTATAVITPVIENPLVQSGLAAYERPQQENPELARDLEGLVGVASLALDVAGAGIGGRVAKVAERAVIEGADAVGTVAKNTADDAARMANRAKNAVAPAITPEAAIKQVVQGETTDFKDAVKAISSIDIKNVKSSSELLGKLDENIPKLAEVVDQELMKDTGVYKLSDLATTAKTKTGIDVSINYVEEALKNLSELYETIADPVKKANIDELIVEARNNGLSRQEVNEISRIYNTEFGSKAFGKNGDALTSINAQRYENVRKGLKTVARKGIGGEEAKLADEVISATYNTKRLVQKQVEALNKLQQKIKERKLLEKFGYIVAKTADIATGGVIRGVVGGILPRGVGYKVMNALDIEKALEENLKVINRALEAKGKQEFIESLTKIKK